MKKVKELLPGIRLALAPNPSPLTLAGTNTWIVEGWVVDPGPAIESHVAAVRAAAEPVQGVVLTHSHLDHSEAAEAFGGVSDGYGPFEVIATPGHSPDSVCLLRGRVLFTGDTVLGQGSVFIAPGDGSLSAYLASLKKLLTLDLDAICPGHGPLVEEPHAKLREYLDHRLERESRVVDALAAGARTADELLARAWSDVDFEAAPLLRVAAGATLAAHLQKLEEESRLPDGVEPPALAGPAWGET